MRFEARPEVVVNSGLDDNVRRPLFQRLVQLNMPIFNDKAESIDDYLVGFEKLAKAHNIPNVHWAINVASFLQGSARAVCHSMLEEKADNYMELKKALLRHYELTPEAFRKMFREVTKKPTETHPQFHTRVRVLFEKWMKMSGTERSYEGVREIMLKEHVLNTYRKELTVFLAENKLKTLEEIGTVADRYEEAHTRTSTSERKDRTRNLALHRNNGSVSNGNGHNHAVNSGTDQWQVTALTRINRLERMEMDTSAHSPSLL